jgi:hypothetical protein
MPISYLNLYLPKFANPLSEKCLEENVFYLIKKGVEKFKTRRDPYFAKI